MSDQQPDDAPLNVLQSEYVDAARALHDATDLFDAADKQLDAARKAYRYLRRLETETGPDQYTEELRDKAESWVATALNFYYVNARQHRDYSLLHKENESRDLLAQMQSDNRETAFMQATYGAPPQSSAKPRWDWRDLFLEIKVPDLPGDPPKRTEPKPEGHDLN